MQYTAESITTYMFYWLQLQSDHPILINGLCMCIHHINSNKKIQSFKFILSLSCYKRFYWISPLQNPSKKAWNPGSKRSIFFRPIVIIIKYYLFVYFVCQTLTRYVKAPFTRYRFHFISSWFHYRIGLLFTRERTNPIQFLHFPKKTPWKWHETSPISWKRSNRVATQYGTSLSILRASTQDCYKIWSKL